MKKIIFIILLVLLLAGGAAYWWYFMRVPSEQVTIVPNGGQNNGFVPFNRTSGGITQGTIGGGEESASSSASVSTRTPIPVIRQLSATPVGGFGASTTASTTILRWIDRGRGNVYEAAMDSLDITTISNTLLPRIYQSWWNKNDNLFIGQYLEDGDDKITTVIANILKREQPKTATSSTSTATSSIVQQISSVTETPYELKGKIISGNIIDVAASPKRDRILVVTNENGSAVGYISNFDGSKQTQSFVLPFTQLTADWPEENTITIVTKASSKYAGYLYLIGAKNGLVKQVLGGLPGLTAKVSRDAKRAIYSYSDNGRIATAIYDITKKSSSPIVFATLADKCAWSAKFKERAYCGVPTQLPNGTHPDNWYLGKSSSIDGIWMIDASTNDVRQIADLLGQGNAIIDTINLSLSDNDEYLFLMNKNDLSLWSVDLVSSAK